MNRTDESGLAPAVINDDIRGIGLAVRHLVALRHTRIGHIAGPASLSTGAMRRRGVQLAVAELMQPDLPPPIVARAALDRHAATGGRRE